MIEVGDVLPLGTQVVDANGDPAAGGAVSVSLSLNGAVVAASPATLTVANPEVGVYLATWTVAAPGRYEATWTVTGANAGTSTDVYNVEYPEFGIVSLAEVKDALKIRRTDQDEDLKFCILQASDLAEGPEGTNKIWRRRVVTNEVHNGGRSFQLELVPVQSITTITVDGTSSDLTGIDISMDSGWVYGVEDYSGRNGRVLVSYVAGPTGPVPAGLRAGVIELVRHLMASRRGGSGIPRQDEPDFSNGPGYLIPNRVAMIFRNYSGGF